VTSEKREAGKADGAGAGRRPWEPMTVRYTGSVSELVQGGGGKTGAAADPGDFRKPPGQN
jgi:hypothetical protein